MAKLEETNEIKELKKFILDNRSYVKGREIVDDLKGGVSLTAVNSCIRGDYYSKKIYKSAIKIIKLNKAEVEEMVKLIKS